LTADGVPKGRGAERAADQFAPAQRDEGVVVGRRIEKFGEARRNATHHSQETVQTIGASSSMPHKKKYEFGSAPDEEYIPETLTRRPVKPRLGKRRRLQLMWRGAWLKWARWCFYYRVQWAVRG
jgi:hypothetical protein